MEARECLGKALGCLIAIAESDIDDRIFRASQVDRCLIQPAVSDVFADVLTRHEREAALQKDRRDKNLAGDILYTDVFFKIILDKLNRCPDACEPFHVPFLLPLMMSV